MTLTLDEALAIKARVEKEFVWGRARGTAVPEGFKWDAWDAPEFEFPDGARIIRLRDMPDMVRLGQLQGHCSGGHWPWVCNDTVEYFWVQCSADQAPVSTIHAKARRWLNRPHPLDKTLRDTGVPEVKYPGGYQWITSTHYDSWVDSARTDTVPNARRALEYTQRDYEYYKQAALRWGPLGKDNPYKRDMDACNRKVSSCLEVLRKAEAKEVHYTGLYTGDVIRYERRHVVIIAFAGRGGYDVGVKDSVTERWRQWVDSFNGFVGPHVPRKRDSG